MRLKSNALNGLGLEINLSILCWKAWISLSPETLRICKALVFPILSQYLRDRERDEKCHLLLCFVHSLCCLPDLTHPYVSGWSLHLDEQDKESGKGAARALSEWHCLTSSGSTPPGKTQQGKERGSTLLRGWTCYSSQMPRGQMLFTKMDATYWTSRCRRGFC